MGELAIAPDCLIDDIIMSETYVLPGADILHDPRHDAIIGKANELLSMGGTVCAVCGATIGMANFGLLDHRSHTSNGVGFLDMFSPTYKGQSFYKGEASIAENNLNTASSAGLYYGRNKSLNI